MMLEKIFKKYEFIFKALFTAALTATLIQSGWLAVGIIVFILVVAIAGLELIQSDKEQKQSKADKLAEALEKIEALEKKLQGSKKEGTKNE